MATALPYVYWRGVRMDSNSIPSLLMAEKKSGIKIVPSQGGYNKGGVAASAGTHDGGAVIDISTRGLSKTKITSLVKWLRLCGWAAWYRTPAQGFIYHIHAVRNGDASASKGAKAQTVSFKNKRNGLKGNGPDDGPWVGYITWANSKYNPANAPKKPSETMTIQGKKYKNITTVRLKWVLREYNKYAKKQKTQMTREVAVVQSWLRSKGYATVVDGYWGKQTQTNYDKFRAQKMGLKGNAAKGAPGLTSMRALLKGVKTSRKVAA